MAKLGFGLMRLPLKDSKDQKSVDIEQLKRMVDTYLDAGFDYFDTAYMYHDGCSETVVREALVDRYPRDRYRLATKMPLMMISSPEDQERVFSEQLERTGVDFFDYYLVHNVCNQFLPMAERCGTFDFVRRLKAEGRARRIGFSFHDGPELLDRVLTENPDMDFVQLQINYLDWEDASIASKGCYEVARRHGVPIIVMEPVKGGMLADVPDAVREMFESVDPGMSPASWAIRFAAGLDGVETVLSGMTSMEQMEDNLSFMSGFGTLSGEEMEAVSKAVGMIRETIAIPCTSCRYCMKSCPKDISIAEFFAQYNSERAKPTPEGGFSLAGLYYSNIVRGGSGKASDCIGCGVCEDNCPQHLPIREYLKDVAALFEPKQ